MVHRLPMVRVMVGVAVALLLFGSGCATTQTDSSSPYHSWEGDISGMISGKIKLKMQIAQVNRNTKAVSGTIFIKFGADSSFGEGYIEGAIKGKIKDGKLDATFSGLAFAVEGQSPISGSLMGTLSFSSGGGRWAVTTATDAGTLSGNWIVRSL